MTSCAAFCSTQALRSACGYSLMARLASARRLECMACSTPASHSSTLPRACARKAQHTQRMWTLQASARSRPCASSNPSCCPSAAVAHLEVFAQRHSLALARQHGVDLNGLGVVAKVQPATNQRMSAGRRGLHEAALRSGSSLQAPHGDVSAALGRPPHSQPDAVKALLQVRLHGAHVARLAEDLEQLVVGQEVKPARAPSSKHAPGQRYGAGRSFMLLVLRL